MLLPITLLVMMAIASPNLSGCIPSPNLNSRMTNSTNNSATYFGSWKSYQIPFVPEEPISQEEAEKRRSYYIGYYNSSKQLERFEKYLDAKLEWQDQYVYWDNGKLKTRSMNKADGSQIIQNFDRRGNIIK
ncbi:hypothetical protein Cylst_3396 [Cylindrospermum stagnale PCC 7417]|uniref:MORN repeat protein n=1 Tax=Cylindrospermum stagnale PCC 7417 TaxID=56107 RepID=K9X0G6_9NOST|nr:DUF6156 family protein [Cylindrospermum stagnale]AFZ25546.1 hypothetical protein Cylst_3396 [Cylindrospermum stagnale PCC 7417]